MPRAHYHVVKRQKNASPFVKTLDLGMLIIGSIGPLATLPQAVEIFTRHDAGSVSLLSWLIFVFVNGYTLLYGIVHKLLPIIASNTIWVIVDTSVVIGCLVYR